MNRAARLAGAWLIPLLVLLLLAACSSPPPGERALRETVDALEVAGEAGSVGDFMTYVAADFGGPPEAIDARGLRGFLQLVALRARNISVTRTRTEVRMHGDRAVVLVDMLVTASSSGGLLPDQGRSITAETGWRIDDGEWRLISARWQ